MDRATWNVCCTGIVLCFGLLCSHYTVGGRSSERDLSRSFTSTYVCERMRVCTAMLAFMAWMFRTESIDLYSWIGIVGSIGANVLIARPPFLVEDEDSLVWDIERIGGLVCAFLSVLFIATSFLLVG